MYRTNNISGVGSVVVNDWRNWGVNTYTSSIDDVAIFTNLDSHIGIVTSVSGGSVTVVHGNSSDSVACSVYNINSFTCRCDSIRLNYSYFPINR